MKASDHVIQCLEEEGVELIFGVPGEENADLMMSLLDSDIRFIICRHEQGAAFMADVYGRLTGYPGVCLATLGPGATNLVTGVANANMDRSPVVALTGQGSTDRLHKESHQAMDVVAMFRPFTQWAHSIRRPDNIAEVVRKAFKVARMESPGATHIELPEDIAKMDVELSPIPRQYAHRRPAPASRSIRAAAEMIQQARFPVILAGNGCVRTRVSAELRELVDRTGIYVAHTFMGKGALDDRHDRSLFTVGLGSRDHVNTVFDKADLVLAIGYNMVEWLPENWNTGRAKRLVHIDFEPAEVDSHYGAEVELVGDIASGLRALNEELDAVAPRQFAVAAEERLHMQAELREFDQDRSFPMKPQKILSDLRALMADDDILISDVGAHKLWVARHYPTYVPGTCIITNGFCSMGIALPGAIAAKMVHPERRVVGLMGDGGIMMNLQELSTAVQYRVPSVNLVFEDGRYGLIEWKQMNAFGRSSHVEFPNPDFVKLAESFGAFGVRVESPDHFPIAMEQAFAQTDRPSLVVVPVDHTANFDLTERLGNLIAHG
jgi:acetolactate synthase I/II/III large subunit